MDAQLVLVRFGPSRKVRCLLRSDDRLQLLESRLRHVASSANVLRERQKPLNQNRGGGEEKRASAGDGRVDLGEQRDERRQMAGQRRDQRCEPHPCDERDGDGDDWILVSVLS